MRHIVYMVIIITGGVVLLFGLILPWATDGRIGVIWVRGDSLMKYMPEGSSVISLPLRPRENDFVVARTSWPDDRSDTEAEDGRSKLSIKIFQNGVLTSSNAPTTYSKYLYRSRVVGYLPTYKIFWWRNTGKQNENPGFTNLHRDLVGARPLRVYAKIRWEGGQSLFPGQTVIGRFDRPATGEIVDAGSMECSVQTKDGAWRTLGANKFVDGVIAIKAKRPDDADPTVPVGVDRIALVVKTLKK